MMAAPTMPFPAEIDRILQEAAILERHGSVEEADRRYARAGKLIDRASDSDAHYNLGVVLQQARRYEAALAQFRKSGALRESADSLANMATCLQILGRHEEALTACMKALAREEMPEAHNTAGNALHSLGRYEEAIAHFERALALRPTFAVALINLGTALRAQLRHDEALDAYSRAHALDPTGEAEYCEAITRLRVGDYLRGWDKYEGRWRRPGRAHPGSSIPLWLGKENLAGKKIVVEGEQGLGDQIQFARYVPRLAELAGEVILKVDEPLVPLLNALPGVSRTVSLGEAVAADYRCPLLSLPRVFRTTLESIPPAPYISVNAEKAAQWRTRLGDGFLVGIAWSSNPKFENANLRDVPFEGIAPLFEIEGVRFVSLQKEVAPKQRAWLARRNFFHPADTFTSVAHMVGALDLIVSVDTGWVHWAGAIGKPTFVLLAHDTLCDWRWLLGREDSPWYPTLRLLRQEKPRDWTVPIERAAKAIRTGIADPQLR